MSTLLAFVAALAILIVVHELGHYLAARFCNVKVLRFSIGFGRPVFSVCVGPDRTEWVLSLIPFGGYVKMLDEREGEVDEFEARRAFNRKTVWARSFIVLAGPLFNFIFAILVYAGMFAWGIPEARPLVAGPSVDTVAYRAGFLAGDQITIVNDARVSTWHEVRWHVLEAALQGTNLRVQGLRNDQPFQVRLDLTGFKHADPDSDLMAQIGLRLFRPKLDAVIGELVKGGSAHRAGLVEGMRILKVDDSRIDSWEEFVAMVRASPGIRLQVRVLDAEGVSRSIELIPETVTVGQTTFGRIGAGPLLNEDNRQKMFVTVQHPVHEAFIKGVVKTWDVSTFSLRMLGRMILGEVSWRHLSGPITIADFAGQSAKLGWTSYLTFLCLVSISLGVLNLLPIPMLDGGHLMYYAVEIVKGTPVSERAIEAGYRVGFALILVMTAFALFNDLNRLFSS